MRAFAMFSQELDESLTHNFLPNLKLPNNFSAKVMYFASKARVALQSKTKLAHAKISKKFETANIGAKNLRTFSGSHYNLRLHITDQISDQNTQTAPQMYFSKHECDSGVLRGYCRFTSSKY